MPALTTTVAILIGVLIGGSAGVGITWTATSRQAKAQQAVLNAEIVEKATALGRCEAEQAPKTVTAAGTVIDAANAPDIADTALRAAVVEAIPQTIYAEAIVKTGNARLIAVEAAMARCSVSNTTGDSSRSGCATTVPATWGAAVAGLDACAPCTVTEDECITNPIVP